MRKYIEPVMEFIKFDLEDILTSSEGSGSGTEGSTLYIDKVSFNDLDELF